MYQIVLTENRVKLKVLHTYSREHDANHRLDKLKNDVAFFPKTKVYKDKKLVNVVYEIILIKKREESDKNRIVKNEIGKFVEETLDDMDWIIINRGLYQMEEQFNVSGANRKLNAKELIDHVLLNSLQKDNPKQVVMLNNKLVIEGLNLNLITCKNIDETIRLYNKIRTYCYENKILNVIFFGSVPKENRKGWYKKAHERTGIGYNRLYRSNSR